jgi:hypothetical protein
MPQQTKCFTVSCRYCNSLIPLLEYDPNSYYVVADTFAVRHSDQMPTVACSALGSYGYSDLRTIAFEHTRFFPYADFASTILPL